MGRLIVMRHAKSSWPDGVADVERPLSGRGRRDATVAGRWLREQGLRPHLALVSSALRTRQTFAAVTAELGGATTDADIRDDLYGAGAGDLLDAVRAVPTDADTVLLIGHNPGIGMLAALLDDGTATAAEDGGMLGYPTAATTVLEVETPWERLDPGTVRAVAFTVPRG